jgi:hypothetical protein
MERASPNTSFHVTSSFALRMSVSYERQIEEGSMDGVERIRII